MFSLLFFVVSIYFCVCITCWLTTRLHQAWNAFLYLFFFFFLISYFSTLDVVCVCSFIAALSFSVLTLEHKKKNKHLFTGSKILVWKAYRRRRIRVCVSYKNKSSDLKIFIFSSFFNRAYFLLILY